jgi:hypothetical protein
MSKQLYSFDDYSIFEFKELLNRKLGFKISSKIDCLKLSEILNEEGFGMVSESTLYRLFLKSDEHKPFKNTLKILCNYIGFDDWQQFNESVDEIKNFKIKNGILPLTNIQKGLLFQCISTKSYKPLNSLFDALVETEQWSKNIISTAIFDSLLHVKSPEIFLKYFASNNFVREEFFEKGVDPTFRIKNYEIGFQYYLENTNPNNSIIDLQNHLFGNTILFRNYFLKKEYFKSVEIGKKLYEFPVINEKELELIFIFPRIRYIAYRLFYFNLIKANPNLIEDYIISLLEYCSKVNPTLNIVERKIIFHTIAEAFLYSSVSKSYQNQLKELFFNEFKKIPQSVINEPLRKILPYFESNGLLTVRPNLNLT